MKRLKWVYFIFIGLDVYQSQVLENIPPPATNVIITITAFVHFILQAGHTDGADRASVIGVLQRV